MKKILLVSTLLFLFIGITTQAHSSVNTRYISSCAIDGGRCQATTKKGTQCKRNSADGSSYCWQHGGSTKDKSSYKSNNNSKATTKPSYSGKTYSGKTVHTGPRGGKYYINKNGKKTYIKRK